MKIQALLTPKENVQPIDFENLAFAEEQAVWAAYANGDLREMYFQAAPLAVTLVFEASDKNAAMQLLLQFPMVAAQLFDIQLTELGHWAPFASFITGKAPEEIRLAS